MQRLWVLCVALLLLVMPRLASAYAVPTLTGPVVDDARVLDASARARIDAQIRAIKGQDGPQIQVYIARSLQGEPIEDVAYQVARAWKLGDAVRDDGVLLLVAIAERKIRIETGKGVGDRVTDLQSADIIRAMGPSFKRGDYAAGVQLAVDRLGRLLGATDGAVETAPQHPQEGGGAWPIALGILLMLVFLVIFSRRGGGGGGGGGGFLAGALLSSGWSERGGGWSSGGGWSGGGGGGWSGGGGGFGGGGASGDW